MFPLLRCPECGGSFDWRTFRFKPGTVGLGCPHCRHLHQEQDLLAGDPDEITCHGCGKSSPVIDMQVVPLTADPRQAEAVVDLPLPPFKFRSGAWWVMLGLLILELPGAAVPFVPFVSFGTLLGGMTVIPLEGISNWRESPRELFALPLFMGLLVTAQTLRALFPGRWTSLELVVGYICATAT